MRNITSGAGVMRRAVTAPCGAADKSASQPGAGTWRPCSQPKIASTGRAAPVACSVNSFSELKNWCVPPSLSCTHCGVHCKAPRVVPSGEYKSSSPFFASPRKEKLALMEEGWGPCTCTLMRPCHSGLVVCSALKSLPLRLGVVQPDNMTPIRSASHPARMVYRAGLRRCSVSCKVSLEGARLRPSRQTLIASSSRFIIHSTSPKWAAISASARSL